MVRYVEDEPHARAVEPKMKKIAEGVFIERVATRCPFARPVCPDVYHMRVVLVVVVVVVFFGIFFFSAGGV